MKVLFWGTPSFALPSLRALGEEGHQIVGVVTQPDRPAGRGRRSRPSPVKEVARLEGYPVFDPELPRGDAFLEGIAELGADLSVVTAYGHILRREVLDLPPKGSINVHASLLPDLRGAAPVNWAVIRGYEITGVTIMRMVEAMDAGPILHQEAEPILPRERASELYDRLAEVGAGALVIALGLFETGLLEEREQDHESATFAPKLSRADARIDWRDGATPVANWIRGMDSVPGAWSELEGAPVKLFRPEPDQEAAAESAAGEVLTADAVQGLTVAAGEGRVSISEVQPAGKKRMSAGDWIRGRGVRAGQRFV